MKPSFIYSPHYYADIGAHVFPVEKYRLIRQKLLDEKLLTESDFLEPALPTREDLLLVHTKEYLDDLESLRFTPRTWRSELPLSKEIVTAYILSAGGTILTCLEALNKGRAVNIGGGFHHTFADHAEGFCYINDIAVGIRKMQKENRIKNACVIDCDLHQGNGTANIFKNDSSVFTFSIHQENLYPLKEKSDWDIGLDDFTGNEVYLEELETAIPLILEKSKPELAVYVAGADPYKEDQLGTLRLTIEGLKERDRLVFEYCKKERISVAVVLAGGYAVNVLDTVTIHTNTCKAAMGM
ncbi:MAG: histone deacetylase [Candidatus Edwardsbacteria bacterium]